MSEGEMLQAAKEVIRIVTSAGLTKDVIDLLEKKIELIAEEGKFYKRNLEMVTFENDSLRSRIKELEEQLQNASQHDTSLEKECADILFLFFDLDRNLRVDEVARHFGFQSSVARAHFDALQRLDFVYKRGGIISPIAGRSTPAEYCITAEGRAHVMKQRRNQSRETQAPKP